MRIDNQIRLEMSLLFLKDGLLESLAKETIDDLNLNTMHGVSVIAFKRGINWILKVHNKICINFY